MASIEKTRISNGIDQNLPEDFYPACWQEDERMENLFAPFRDRSVNPLNFDAKMMFWKNLIREYLGRIKNSPTFSLGELRTTFQRKGKKPYCLDTVLKEMLLSDSSVKEKSQFIQEVPSHSWAGWAVNKMIKQPLRWGFDRIKERVISTPSNGNSDENTEYVHLEVAKVVLLLIYFPIGVKKY